jgi:hypothetical protein
MYYAILLFLEIIFLFFLSRSVSKSISKFVSINAMSFVFLPGIVVHELSHFLTAAVLFVPAGEMEFAPKREGNSVKLGSVRIAKTDPIRRSIIGFAPIFVGLLIIIGTTYLFGLNIQFFKNKNLYIITIAILALVYLLFSVGNTMFSSKADIKGTLEIMICLVVIFAVANVLGFRPSLLFFNQMFTREIIEIFQKSTLFLLAPIVIDLLVLGTLRVFTGKRGSRNGQNQRYM